MAVSGDPGDRAPAYIGLTRAAADDDERMRRHFDIDPSDTAGSNRVVQQVIIQSDSRVCQTVSR